MAEHDQKTEPATPKRREEAFERGQFAKAPEVQVAFSLLAGLAWLVVAAPGVGRALGGYAVRVFEEIGRGRWTEEELLTRLRDAGELGWRLVMPVALLSLAAVCLGGGLQSRFRPTWKAIEFKGEKLNPLAGLKRLFSLNALMSLPFDLLKLAAVGGAVWIGLRAGWRDPLFHGPVAPAHLLDFLLHSAVIFLLWAGGALAAVAVVSYAWQVFKTERDLRMSRQEVKDEMKSQEGDPLVKGFRRRLARRLLQRQMLDALPLADVVVTNPTHYAVALKYERGRDAAPVVVAKGEGQFARRIKALAAEHGVPMVENRPVARMLHALGKVGEPVPAELYEAVAGILAFVYRTYRHHCHQVRLRRAVAAVS